MRRVVLDTNVLVSALWSKQSNPNKVAEMVFTNELTLYLNQKILEEYFEVLYRDKFGFPEEKVSALLHEISKRGIFADSVQSIIHFADESDRKFHDIAKSNNAVLVTGNLKHYPNESFIMNPYDFLHTLGNE